MAGMFAWRLLDRSGRDVGASPAFRDQAAAEAWVSASWEDLRDRGVEAVELFDDTTGERGYRMSLDEP
jgi:hypothetical protein